MAARLETWVVTAAARGDLSREAAMGTSMVVSGNRVGLKKVLIELQKEIYIGCMSLIACKKTYL